MEPGEYVDLINCSSHEEAFQRVREWSSTLSEHEHLIRSTILDIHASVERLLKQVLYHVLVGYMFHDDEEEWTRSTEALNRAIRDLNFALAYRLLRPLLDAFPAADLASIPRLNDLRNSLAHRSSPQEALYEGRNPFTDGDCLAQVYLDAWAAKGALREFYQKMIEEPRAIAGHFAKFYHDHWELDRPPMGAA